MKIKILPAVICLACLFFRVFPSFAQLTGTKTIPGDYSSVSSAVTALNLAGVGTGGVTFNIASNYTETITATISITATGTVTNPVIFQKDPATTGANPLITAYSGGVGTPATATQDGIWRLGGSDYVTIDGIDLKENPVNTTNPSTMEYGYALYKASTSNGCQFVTIKNCVISLSNINNTTGGNPMTDGSAGIIVMNATATAANVVLAPLAGGTNSNNKFYSNTIQNCNIGISIIGYSAASPFTLADVNNDIGGNSVATGNTIINYGGAAGAINPAAAIRTLAQYGLNTSYNIINNNNGPGTNHPNTLRGIYINAAASASSTIAYNTITLNGGGTTQNVTGIENASGSAPASNTVNISNNTVTNSTYTTATTGGFFGIFNNAASPAILTISNNIVSNNSSSAVTTGFFYGISNSGAATTATISGNSFTGNSTAGLTTGLYTGIYNSGVVSSLSITGNTLSGNSTTATSGVYYPIYNSAAVTTSININSNNIGTALSPAVTFSAANSGAHIFIYNAGGAATAALSISNNNFQGITYAVAGTGANTYISNIAATLSQAINGNTFTGLNVNTAGSITFISNSVIVPATGTQNVNSNSIVTSFTKTGAGGTVTLFTSAAASASGSVINNNSNNFSNITVSGATIIAGWINTDAGSSTKNIQNNTFSNWTAGTGAVTAMSVSITGANNATSGNAVNNIYSAGTIIAISTAAGNDNIYSNTIYNLVSSGTLLTTVNGISVTAGTTKNIYQNIIYDLKGNTLTTGTIRGIVISAGTTINVYQNTIDSLQGNAVTSGSVNGISIAGGTTINSYQNIIYSLTGNSITTGTVNGISISAATTVVAYRNKIYDLSSNSSTITTGTVNGIQVSGATASTNTTLRNNLLGDLRTPSASATDPIRGININSTGVTSNINVYYNTIYLNGISAGTNFGSTGIYHASSAVATTAKLDLRNNIITNISTPNGTGLTVSYRRSSAILTNYASSSNNNLLYSGTSGAARLIFYDGTNADQTLVNFRTRVSPADALSVTEDLITTPKFLSTVGSSFSYLHIDPAKTTQVESGGASIPGITADYDADIRQGNTGYAGTGTTPDIGADEFEGLKLSGLSGTYNVGTGQQFTSLTNAEGLFATINTLGLAGNVTVNITSDLAEDGSNSLYQWAEQGSGNYMLNIIPDGSTLRTISGNVLAGLIRFTGADRVTIDGSSGGSGTYLTFRNTNTAGTTGTAFTLINGATNNTIKYCTIEAYAGATSGIILFSTSTVAGGNSNNRVSNCAINATVSTNTGNLCIYSAGTVGNENSTNTISGNSIYNYKDRALDIAATGSTAWSISSNSFYNGDVAGAINYAAASTLHGIRILGGSGYTILNNYIGGNASLATGTNATYASTAGIISYQGILLTTTSATPASNIKGNTIAKISVSAVPTSATAANLFIGIETNGSGINIGGSITGDGNIIGSNTANSSIVLTTTTTTATFRTNLRGINCASTGGVIIGNQVAGIDIKNIGTAPGPSAFLGIYVNSTTAPSQVNNNIIGSTGTGAASNSIRIVSTSTSTLTSLTGIAIGASVVSAIQVSNNIIQNISYQSTIAALTTGGFIGISSAAAGAAVVSITGNTISANSIATYTTGTFYGIYNSGAAATLSINSNIINGHSTASASGVYYAIYNAGAVSSAININANIIGNSTAGAITFSAANSGAQVFIYNGAGTAAAALSISNNNFQGITYSAGGTSSNTYILNSAATLSQAINGNIFTSLNINTTGAITFISNSVIVPATGTQNVNSNSISGTFTKAGAGTVTLFTSTANSISGSVINNNSNNFSNITVSGAAIIGGWVNTDAGASTKNIQNNIFSNWTGGTGTITALAVSLTGTNNSTTGNLINNISSAGAITAITTAAGNDNIYSNIINTLSTTGAFAVSGIVVTAGTAKNIYRNKIYDLQANNATGTVNGILVSGAAMVTINIFNNLIGDLKTPIENSAADAIRGISVIATALNSTINVYYNTIYLNATSSGAAFSTSGIYHTMSATATTASLNLRNNSITNTSTPKGAGLTVAYRRSGTTLTNYASTSNNNLFYAGVPGSTKLVFYDGTNADQTIAAYKTRMSTRDALSVTEDLSGKFLSTAGSSSVFLHMDASQPTNVESGAVNIAAFTEDVDGQVRAGNTGYTGTGTSPDIGADEIFGIEAVPPTITYTLLANTTSTVNRGVTGISITDASGINIASGTKPRIYYKRLSDANTWLDNSSSTNGWKYTEATSTSSPFTFTIDYSLLYGGASVTAGVIQYFIVAQDLATTANIAINSGTFATAPSSVALTSAAFPIGGTINNYNIPFAGTYNVGSNEIFTSLTKADGLFASINTVGFMANTTFNITSDLSEDGTNALNQWSESGVGNYTMLIQPDGTTLRTVSGNVTTGLIRLNGTDRLTIEGSSGGNGSYISFKNTNTAGNTGTAFSFINGATNNTIRNCDVQAYANGTNGVILFGASAVAGGNSNNLIDDCTINATVTTNTGNVAIYSGGTAGNENSSNTISNNNIYNYRDRAIDISATGSTAWTVSGNSFYNGDVTGTINYAASSALHGVRILGGSGYLILNNYIGGNATLASGSNAVYASTLGNVSYQGISLTTSSASPVSNIKGNTVAALSLSSAPASAGSVVFTGIETNGSGINIGGSAAGEGNHLGSATTNGSIIITTSTTLTANTSIIKGINCASTGGSIIANQVAGFDINNIGTAPSPSSFTGMYINNASAPSQVLNNIIGSNGTSNSIRVLSTSSATTTSLTGISIGSSVNSNILVNGNIIENISQLSLTSSGNFTGISNGAAGGVCTISSDTIQNITTAANANSGSTAYIGIFSGTTSSVSNNVINNISLLSSGTNAQIMGISVSGAFAHSITGNSISGLATISAKTGTSVETGSPAASSILGILNAATVAGQVISGNTLYNFNATNNTSVNTIVTGIGVTATVSGNIFNNRIASFTNNSTGTGPGICGIMAANGSFNLYNNSIKLDNSANINGVKIYGIIHAAGNNWNYYFNTIRIGGNATGTALRSAAFIRPVAGNLLLRNNVFINTRAGSGLNYAISNLVAPPASTWPSTASDYNNLFSNNQNTTGEWGLSTNKTLAQWQASSGGEGNSVSKPVSFIPSVYDLQPDSSSNCALNNSGTPVTSPVIINTDINNISRNSVSPDMGAYEFNYSAFTIIAGSNSPVCSGDSVILTVDPGTAISPSYSWSNPANAIISTARNPTIAPVTGRYNVSVTDINGCYVTDSTEVLVNQRPAATLTSITSLCDSGFVNLNISVTGTGTISGVLSNGDTFSGTAPSIIVPVYVTNTTSYSILSLSDSTCTANRADIPDTVTVTVTHKGDWLGITTNWSDPVNWCGGIIPTSSTDVTIPAGTLKMPVITDSAYCNNLTINSGDTLTIAAAGTLNIADVLTSMGTYNDRGTTNFNGTSGQQTFSGVSAFNNLALNNTNGLLLPAAITVSHNLLIGAGTLNANNFGITIGGNWINNVSTTGFTAGTSFVNFNGTGAQGISGTFATTFNDLIVSNIAGTVGLSINTNIAGNCSVSGGTFDLAGFTANRTAAGGTLSVANSATLKIGGTGTFPLNYTTNTLMAASTVEYSGTNQSVANKLYGNLTLSSSGGAAIKAFPATALTVAGNLSSTLGAGTSVSFTAAAGIAVGGNVSIGTSTTFNGGSFSHSIAGNWVNSGTFNGNTSTITFTGPGTTVSGTGTQNFNNLTVAAAGVTFSSNNITLTGNLATSGTGSFTQATGGTLLMTGTGTTISGSGISLYNLTLTGSTTGVTSFLISGDLVMNSGSVFNAGSYTYTIKGKISSSGTINSGTSTFILSGTGTQDVYTLSDFNNVTLNKASGFATLSSNVAVKGLLNFTAGSIQTGSNILSQPSTGTVTGAAQNTGWVNGNFQKNIATGNNVSKIFEVGDDNYYTPVTVLFASVSVSGNLTASTASNEHPQIDFSGLNKNLDLNRYWTLINTAVGFTTASATFNWVSSDVDAGATTANFKASTYSGSSWAISQITSPSPLSIQATGVTSFGSFAIGEGFKVVTWTGAAGTADWFTAGNWFGGVPDGTVETIIPSALQPGNLFPVISTGTATVDSLTIQHGASLTLTNSTLQIKGAIINNGTFDASHGTINEMGSDAQTIAANTFQNNALNNLVISNTSAAGVILGGALDIYGSLSYTGYGMNLTTNDSLSLKSTALATASVGDMTGNTISGKVTVERYISARKAWRLLSIPTNTTQTTQQAWQEGCGSNLNCVAHFGTQITGPGGPAAGFDAATSISSIKTYSAGINNWTNITSTNSTSIKTAEAYMIFIRGDRAATTINSVPTETVLRTTGTLYTGDQTPIPVIAGKFASIGNPYASSLDMRLITKTGLKDFFYVWDPKLGGSNSYGGYQTFSYNNGDYVITPGLGSYGAPGSISNYIQSGQGFLVQAGTSGGTVTFREEAKANAGGQASAARGLSHPQLRTTLYGVNTNNSTYIIDGVLSNYADSYSNNVDDLDAVKSANSAENLAIKTGNKLLVIERRQTIVNGDTIFLDITNTKIQKYRFEFAADQMGDNGLTAFFEDNYLHTSAPLDLTGNTIADFSIVNIPGSYAADRFRIVFKQVSTLPVTFTSVKAVQKNEDITVEWKTENESNLKEYEVEKSLDGNQFATAGKVPAHNTPRNNYQWLDENPVEGYNYYRVVSTDINGKKEYSTIVKVVAGKSIQNISVYPNPVINGAINLQLVNQPAGQYRIKLFNKMGQVMISKRIDHAEGNNTRVIQMDKSSAHGIYQLVVTGPAGDAVNINVMY